jgi:hypothetical protein
MIPRRLISVVAALSLLSVAATGCGTATGAAVGTGAGAAVGAGTGYGAGKGALIGLGVDQNAGKVTIRDSKGTTHEFQANRETLQEMKPGDKIEAKLREAPKC